MCYLGKKNDILNMDSVSCSFTYSTTDEMLNGGMVQMEKEILFEARHMRKEFGPTVALKDVDFTLRRGEIRGLVGENGSGKSTIMSIASGMQPATRGEMLYKGQPWKPGTMVEAQDAGISMILQEANTIPGVTVAQNIFSGHESEFSRFGVINMQKMKREAQKALESFGIGHIKAGDLIDKYTFEDRKLVEIVRCVTDQTEILVVDETTTALSLEGREILYKLIHRMADQGKGVVFVSHDMDEILEQCTDLTVLRDGEIIGHLTREEMDAPDSVKTIRYMKLQVEMPDPAQGHVLQLQGDLVAVGSVVILAVILVADFAADHHVPDGLYGIGGVHFLPGQMPDDLAVPQHRQIRALLENLVHIMGDKDNSLPLVRHFMDQFIKDFTSFK